MASTLVLENELSKNGAMATEVIDIRPSVSEVGCSSHSAARASISMDPDKLGVIIGKSISEAMTVLRSETTLPLQSKLL